MIGLERAVGLRGWWPYVAPALTGAGAVMVMAGSDGPGAGAVDHRGQPLVLGGDPLGGEAAEGYFHDGHVGGRAGVGGGKSALAGGLAVQPGCAVVDRLPGADDRGGATGPEPVSETVQVVRPLFYGAWACLWAGWC